MTDVLNMLCEWYNSQCNGIWEHGSGIRIETIDNPGWHVEINLEGTSIEGKKLDKVFMEKSDSDWLYLEIKEKRFIGAGDSDKLPEIVMRFLDLT